MKSCDVVMKSCDVGDDIMWHDDNVNTEVIDDLPDKFNKESNTNIKNKHFTKKYNLLKT